MIQHTLPSWKHKPVGSAAHRQTIHIDVIPDTEYILPAVVQPFHFGLHCRRTPQPFPLLCVAEHLLLLVFAITRHGMYVRWEDMQWWREALFRTRKWR